MVQTMEDQDLPDHQVFPACLLIQNQSMFMVLLVFVVNQVNQVFPASMENQVKTVYPVQMEKAEKMVMLVSLAAQGPLAGLVSPVHLDLVVHQEQGGGKPRSRS